MEFGPGMTSIDCGTSNLLAVTGSLTIAMWLKPGELGQRRNPFYKSYGGEGAITIETDGFLSYFYGPKGDDVDPVQQLGSTTPLQVAVWTHIVLVRDLGPAMRLSWFINGQRNNEAAAEHAKIKASPRPVMIGLGYTNEPYIGLIDDLGIWPRALNDVEVRQLYEASAAGR